MTTVIRKLCRRFSIYRDVSRVLVWRGMTREGTRIGGLGL
jgi:hypothetical protein